MIFKNVESVECHISSRYRKDEYLVCFIFYDNKGTGSLPYENIQLDEELFAIPDDVLEDFFSIVPPPNKTVICEEEPQEKGYDILHCRVNKSLEDFLDEFGGET